MRRSFELTVPHAPEQMFALVADLDAYPRFLPNCEAMSVRPDPSGGQLARMSVSFGPMTRAYTSRVEADPEAGTIRARAVDGPFSHLDSLWRFEPDGQGTRVRFEIDFAISNPLLAAVAEPAFSAKQDEIVRAFVVEAGRRYGTA